MLDMIWNNIGLFTNPKQALIEFQHHSSKKMFGYGLMISVFSMVSYYTGSMLAHNVSVYIILVRLISYYIGTFLFLSLVCTTVFIFYKKINVIKFLGIYLTTDLPMVLIWPFSLMSLVFPMLSSVVAIITGVVFVGMYTFKIYTIKTLLRMSTLQTLITLVLLAVLVLFWFVTTIVGVVNQFVLLNL